MLSIIKWLSVNELTLNTDKAKVLVFDNANFSVRINLLGIKYFIKECKSINYLCLVMENHLKFDLYIVQCSIH